jgi:hypothetical protein
MNLADPGVWIGPAWDYERLKQIAAAGFAWVALPIHDGPDAVVRDDYPDLTASARSLGLELCGYGWVRGGAGAADAETADRQLAAWQLEAYIAEPLSFLGVDAFLARWLELRPGFPLGLSSGFEPGIRYAPWITAGAHAIPQGPRPEDGVRAALDVRQPWAGPPFGFPLERIHPCFDAGLAPAEAAKGLLRTSARGFSISLREETELEALGLLLPALVGIGLVLIDPEAFPYTGPLYGPSDTRESRESGTAKALKRALNRLGFLDEPELDGVYSAELERALANWQRGEGISPTGQYGRGSYEALRGAATADGAYAMDETARSWVKEDA